MEIVKSIRDILKKNGRLAAINKLKGLHVAQLNSIVTGFTADNEVDAAAIVSAAKKEIQELENEKNQTTGSDSSVAIEEVTQQPGSTAETPPTAETKQIASTDTNRKKFGP